MSAAVSLWRLLEACEAENLEPPAQTRHVTATPELCELLAHRLRVPFYVAIETLGGLPVKEARGLVTWASGIAPEERIGVLRARARRRRLRGAA